VVDFKPGTYPVIFAPDEVGHIINPVVMSLNGMSVVRKMSPWTDKLGQEMLDSRFTLIDDGSKDNAWTSKPFDSEGTPTRRNVLVQNGVLGDLLTDRKVAALLGKESTGNAGGGGGFGNIGVMPGPHHLILGTGSKSLQDLIAEIDYGMIIYGTMGAWSGNPYAGVVSGTVSMGLKIEKGKIVGRTKDCMFTINAFEHLKKHFIDCSNEAKDADGNLFPYVMLDKVVISTN
jgi:PmbA protein